MTEYPTKRQVPRIKVHLPVTIAHHWRAECLEIGALGMKIRCQGLLALGTPVDAVLLSDDGPIPFHATVVWRHPPDFGSELPGEMGLGIEQPPKAYLELVAKLFAKKT